MLKFRNITLFEIPTLQKYIKDSTRQNCDISLANLCGWQFFYNTQLAESEDWLFIRFQMDGRLAYALPLYRNNGQKNTINDADYIEGLRKAIMKAYSDSVLMGQQFIMMCTDDAAEKAVSEAVPVQLQTLSNPDLYDYIYSCTKLQLLAGKKLQSKRNHVNRFRKLYPDYKYVSLTEETATQCLEVEKKWIQAKRESYDGDVSAYDAEYRFMTFTLSNWQRLGLTGGAIFVNGTMVAFSFGCPINNYTFDVCCEKADTSFEGSFSIINQEFACHLPPQYIYINREEDLGNPGLRQAKSSYIPDIRLCKRLVMSVNPDHQFLDTDTAARQTIKLWSDTFHDPELFIRLYFSRVFSSSHNITAQLEDCVAGALQLLPHTFRWNRSKLSAAYLSGLAVKSTLRRQGIGSALLSQAHLAAFNKGKSIIFLIPAEKWLFGWYASHGYADIAKCLPPPSGFESMDFVSFDHWQNDKSCILLKDPEGFSIYLQDYRATPANLRQSAIIPAMLRIINVHEVLSTYADLHPEAEQTINVCGDEDLPQNNACFHISNGIVQRSYFRQPQSETLTLAQLAEKLFADEQPSMSLMFI